MGNLSHVTLLYIPPRPSQVIITRRCFTVSLVETHYVKRNVSTDNLCGAHVTRCSALNLAIRKIISVIMINVRMVLKTLKDGL